MEASRVQAALSQSASRDAKGEVCICVFLCGHVCEVGLVPASSLEPQVDVQRGDGEIAFDQESTIANLWAHA